MDQKVNVTKKFVEEVGWIVTETPIGQPLPAGELLVAQPAPEPAQPVRVVTVDDISLSMAQEVLSRHGFVAIPREIIETLPKTHQETLTKAAGSAPAALDDAAIIAKIGTATTMEELEAMMDGVTSPAVISAAETKALELTEEPAE